MEQFTGSDYVYFIQSFSAPLPVALKGPIPVLHKSKEILFLSRNVYFLYSFLFISTIQRISNLFMNNKKLFQN